MNFLGLSIVVEVNKILFLMEENIYEQAGSAYFWG